MLKTTWIAASQLFLSLLLLGGVWLALPARWLWVDLPTTLLALAAGGIALALLLRAPWAMAAARVLLWVELAFGTLLVTLLALSIAQLAGSYGPVGAGGAVLMGTIALLIVPYLVALPALQLAVLRKLGG
jgi:hypothetical protein